MTVLTIYTDRFDALENICGRGMSGKVFLEESNGDAESGIEFKAVDEALAYCDKHFVDIDRIDFHYLGNYETQMFRKFGVVAPGGENGK